MAGARDLDELGAAAREFLQANPPGGVEVPAHPALRLAAGACDFVIGLFLSAAASCVLFWGVTILVGEPSLDMSKPVFSVLMALAAAAYSLPEAYGHPTLAKPWFGLRLSALGADPRRAYKRRWLAKASPWLVLAGVWAAGVIHIAARTDPAGPDSSSWARGLDPRDSILVAGAAVFVAFLFCFGAGRQALYDRAGGTLVVRKVPLHQQRGRGFDVIPTASVAQPPGEALVPPDGPALLPEDECRPRGSGE